jgi:hypothetical protein
MRRFRVIRADRLDFLVPSVSAPALLFLHGRESRAISSSTQQGRMFTRRPAELPSSNPWRLRARR